MSEPRPDLSRLLRWYPPSWRDRYGDELLAMMEDTLGERRATLGFRLSITMAGIRERSHIAGLVGETVPPAERVRGGGLVVMAAWTAFVLAGAAFAKLSEHSNEAVATSQRLLIVDTYRIVIALAVVTALAVVAGGMVAARPLWQLLRGNDGLVLRRRLWIATTWSVVAAAATAGLVVVAHRLPRADIETGAWPYGAIFIVWAIVIGAALVAWTSFGIGAVRRVNFDRRALAVESVLAITVAAAMVAMTIVTGVWWVAIAHRAPWFLHGTAPGTLGSAFDIRLASVVALMVLADATAGVGVVRIGAGWAAAGRG
ncbi:MAG: hypothetical protein WBV06_01070 [Acidimicrobiia bacterium]